LEDQVNVLQEELKKSRDPVAIEEIRERQRSFLHRRGMDVFFTQDQDIVFSYSRGFLSYS